MRRRGAGAGRSRPGAGRGDADRARRPAGCGGRPGFPGRGRLGSGPALVLALPLNIRCWAGSCAGSTGCSTTATGGAGRSVVGAGNGCAENGPMRLDRRAAASGPAQSAPRSGAAGCQVARGEWLSLRPGLCSAHPATEAPRCRESDSSGSSPSAVRPLPLLRALLGDACVRQRVSDQRYYCPTRDGGGAAAETADPGARRAALAGLSTPAIAAAVW